MKYIKILLLSFFLMVGLSVINGQNCQAAASKPSAGTSTPLISGQAENKVKANYDLPVIMIDLPSTETETLSSTTIIVATTTTATPTGVTTNSFDWVGVVKDTNGNGSCDFPTGDTLLATSTVNIGASSTINIATTTLAEGVFFVVLKTSSHWTDNNTPEISGAVGQAVAVTINSNGVVASSSSPTINATTTQSFVADTHSQAPDQTKVGQIYQDGHYYLYDLGHAGGVGESGIIRAYNASSSGNLLGLANVNSNGNFNLDLGTSYQSVAWLELSDALNNATSSPRVPVYLLPLPPTNLSATAGDGRVTLNWSAVSGATKYDIYRKSGLNYAYLAQTSNTSYADTNLTNGTIYYYKVSALSNADQESAATDAVSATPVASSSGGGTVLPSLLGDTTPASISDISVSVKGAVATISWKTSEPSISWLVYGTTTDYGLEIKTTDLISSHSVILSELLPQTIYHYQIKAKDGSGNVSSYTDKTLMISASKSLSVSELSSQSSSLQDGDLIRNPNAQGMAKYDVYIVKIVGDKKYKRLIINPKVF
ncbi:MAG TPA: hypothetical protein ENL06_03940, partial [Candidatus Portnoybacteria bacterium]|nr:hypothetical protein [Candidatus Portnoybacteria bacterium]